MINISIDVCYCKAIYSLAIFTFMSVNNGSDCETVHTVEAPYQRGSCTPSNDVRLKPTRMLLGTKGRVLF